MAAWRIGGRLPVVVSAIVVWGLLGGCEQKPEEAATAQPDAAAVTAPGPVTGNEPLPAGHPPIPALQEEVPAETAGGALPPDHAAMLAAGDGATARPDDEPEHPPSSGRELAVAIPDSVKEGWSAVQLGVLLPDGREKEIRMILGEETQLPDPSLTVRAEIFLPAYISDFETIKSASNELTNPAVKLRLFKDREAVAVGWVFQNLPEFNSFESEWVTFQLLSAEAAK